MTVITFEALIGKTITKIDKTDDRITFALEDGEQWLMWHSQDCCEHVSVEDIIGDLEDLIGSPLTECEEVSSSNENPEGVKKEYQDHSFTWTFYKLGTSKGSVTIRWYGMSNGYYSESVTFEKLLS